MSPIPVEMSSAETNPMMSGAKCAHIAVVRSFPAFDDGAAKGGGFGYGGVTPAPVEASKGFAD